MNGTGQDETETLKRVRVTLKKSINKNHKIPLRTKEQLYVYLKPQAIFSLFPELNCNSCANRAIYDVVILLQLYSV